MRLSTLHRRMRSMTRLERQVDRLLAEQASEWVEVMKRPGSLDRIMFARWLKKDARHAVEFIAMEGLDRMLQGIDSERRHDVQALLSTASTEVISLSDDF